MPLRAFVALPALQLSTSWVDFGTCFVNQQHTREIYLMNHSSCLSYWTVLMGTLWGRPHASGTLGGTVESCPGTLAP